MAENDVPKKLIPWTDKELAFAFNLLDKCLRDGIDYKETVSEELSKFQGHERSWSGTKEKMRKFCSAKALLDPSIPFLQILEEGTRILKVDVIPQDVLLEMEEQRKNMNLPSLLRIEPTVEGETNTPGPVIVDSGFNMTDQMTVDPIPYDLGLVADLPRTSKRLHSASRPAYGEDSSSERGSPLREDKNDGDWANEEDKRPPNKRQKTGSFIPESPPPTDQDKILTVVDDDVQTTDNVERQKVDQEEIQTMSNDVTPELGMSKVTLPATDNPPETLDSITVFVPVQQVLASNVENFETAEPNNTKTFISHQKEQRLERFHEAAQDRTPVNIPAQLYPAHMPLLDGTNRIAFQQPTNPQFQSAFTTGPLPIDLTNLMGIVKNLASITGILAKDHMRTSGGEDDQITRRWTSIERALFQNPSNIEQDLSRMLSSMELRNTTLTNHLTTLIGRHDPSADLTFPKIPDRAPIDDCWQSMQHYIHEAVGFDNTEPALTFTSCGFLAARIQDLTEHNGPKIGWLPDFIKRMRYHLRSPNAARALLGAFMIRWLFVSPEPLCEGLYSEKELALYNAKIRSTNGVAEIQHMDKVGMQAVFTSKQFLQGAFHTRAQKLLGRLVGMLKGLMPNASRYVGFAGLKDIEEWIKAAVKLKQTLMISPQDYRIHFCPVGKPFDSTWMKAEDKEGLPVNDAQAKDRTVAACFFPALIEKKPVAFPKDVKLEDILVTNKVFLPSVDEIEALNPIMVVAKATVLVTTGISNRTGSLLGRFYSVLAWLAS